MNAPCSWLAEPSGSPVADSNSLNFVAKQIKLTHPHGTPLALLCWTQKKNGAARSWWRRGFMWWARAGYPRRKRAEFDSCVGSNNHRVFSPSFEHTLPAPLATEGTKGYTSVTGAHQRQCRVFFTLSRQEARLTRRNSTRGCSRAFLDAFLHDAPKTTGGDSSGEESLPLCLPRVLR